MEQNKKLSLIRVNTGEQIVFSSINDDETLLLFTRSRATFIQDLLLHIIVDQKWKQYHRFNNPSSVSDSNTLILKTTTRRRRTRDNDTVVVTAVSATSSLAATLFDNNEEEEEEEEEDVTLYVYHLNLSQEDKNLLVTASEAEHAQRMNLSKRNSQLTLRALGIDWEQDVADEKFDLLSELLNELCVDMPSKLYSFCESIEARKKNQHEGLQVLRQFVDNHLAQLSEHTDQTLTCATMCRDEILKSDASVVNVKHALNEVSIAVVSDKSQDETTTITRSTLLDYVPLLNESDQVLSDKTKQALNQLKSVIDHCHLNKDQINDFRENRTVHSEEQGAAVSQPFLFMSNCMDEQIKLLDEYKRVIAEIAQCQSKSSSFLQRSQLEESWIDVEMAERLNRIEELKAELSKPDRLSPARLTYKQIFTSFASYVADETYQREFGPLLDDIYKLYVDDVTELQNMMRSINIGEALNLSRAVIVGDLLNTCYSSALDGVSRNLSVDESIKPLIENEENMKRNDLLREISPSVPSINDEVQSIIKTIFPQNFDASIDTEESVQFSFRDGNHTIDTGNTNYFDESLVETDDENSEDDEESDNDVESDFGSLDDASPHITKALWESKEQRIESLELSLSKMTTSCDLSGNTIRALEESIEQLSEELKQTQESKAACEEKLEMLEKEQTELRMELMRLATQNERSGVLVEELSAKCEELESTISEKDLFIEQRNTIIEQKNDIYLRQGQDIEKLRKTIEVLKENVVRLEKDNESLRLAHQEELESMRTCTVQITQLEEAKNALLEQLESKNKEVETVKQIVQQMNGALVNKNDELARCKTTIDTLQDQLESQEKLVLDLEKKMASAYASISSYEQEKSSLSDQLETLKAQFEKFELEAIKNQEISKENYHLKVQEYQALIDALNNENTAKSLSLEQSTKDKESMIEKLKKEIENLKRNDSDLEHELSNLLSHIDSMSKQQISSMKEQAAAHDIAISNMERTQDELKKEVELLKTSNLSLKDENSDLLSHFDSLNKQQSSSMKEQEEAHVLAISNLEQINAELKHEIKALERSSLALHDENSDLLSQLDSMSRQHCASMKEQADAHALAMSNIQQTHAKNVEELKRSTSTIQSFTVEKQYLSEQLAAVEKKYQEVSNEVQLAHDREQTWSKRIESVELEKATTQQELRKQKAMSEDLSRLVSALQQELDQTKNELATCSGVKNQMKLVMDNSVVLVTQKQKELDTLLAELKNQKNANAILEAELRETKNTPASSSSMENLFRCVLLKMAEVTEDIVLQNKIQDSFALSSEMAMEDFNSLIERVDPAFAPNDDMAHVKIDKFETNDVVLFIKNAHGVWEAVCKKGNCYLAPEAVATLSRSPHFESLKYLKAQFMFHVDSVAPSPDPAFKFLKAGTEFSMIYIREPGV